MKERKKREAFYSLHASPTPDDPNFQEMMEYYERKMKQDPDSKKIKEMVNKGNSILRTQMRNCCDLPVGKELRHFLLEYNDRLHRYGLGSMPTSFNIIESFFSFNKELFIFELFKEQNFLFSFYDFVDFITSDKNTVSIDEIYNILEDDIIYIFDLINNPRDLTVKTKDNTEFVFAGIAIIKRIDEVTILILGGEQIDPSLTISMEFEEDGFKKSYIRPAPEYKHEIIKLFNQPDLWKTILTFRINIRTSEVNSRYIFKDCGNLYDIITDDFGMLEHSIGMADYVNIVQNYILQLENYNPVFQLAYNCIFLPEYFKINNDIACIEAHPTLLAEEKLKPNIFDKKQDYSLQHFFKSKDVIVVDKNSKSNLQNEYLFNDNQFIIEKNGYWKPIGLGNIGKDKNGNDIHNRTWVEQTLSWYENNSTNESETTSINSYTSINEGYIYILRNAAHRINMFKIGLTTRTVEKRAKELSGTSSPDKFLIAYKKWTKDCVLAEKLIHKELEPYRVNPSREFFDIDFEVAVEVVNRIINGINPDE